MYICATQLTMSWAFLGATPPRRPCSAPRPLSRPAAADALCANCTTEIVGKLPKSRRRRGNASPTAAVVAAAGGSGSSNDNTDVAMGMRMGAASTSTAGVTAAPAAKPASAADTASSSSSNSSSTTTTTTTSGGTAAPAAAVAAAAAAGAASSSSSGGGSAAPAAKHPSHLQLGIDIPVKLEKVTVGGEGGGRQCTFLLVVPSIDEVMELYISAGQYDRDPYWCEPWPSALAMSAELLQRPELVAGRRVCELGCGLGLAGLAAAVAGAAEVVLLDREPLALQCALLNAALNGLPVVLPAAPAAAAGAEALGSGSGVGVWPPSVEQLLPHLARDDVERLREWQGLLAQQKQQALQHAEQAQQAQQDLQHGPQTTTASSNSSSSSSAGGSEPSPGSSSTSSTSSGGTSSGGSEGSGLPPAGSLPLPPGALAGGKGVVRAEVFDWSQPVTLAPHDVMLVCDCLYEAFSVQPVAEVAPRLLTRKADARLLLADPPDRARHNRECFLDILCDEGGSEFLLEESGRRGVPTWEASKGAWRDVPVELMHLRRAGGSGDTVGLKLRRDKV